MDNRIALIMESTTRKDIAMEAYKFYQGYRSRWINAVIQFMETRNFSSDRIFFISLYHKRIIGFDEIVHNYPVSEWHPRKKECTIFASRVLELVQTYNEIPFVEIHAGKTVADPIKALLSQHNISCRNFAEGVPLGTKPSFYEALIEEELNKRKLKDIQKERITVAATIHQWSPQEASLLVGSLGTKAQLYGVENGVQELKNLLGDWNQKKKDEKQALKDFESMITEEDHHGELECFLSRKVSLASLISDPTEYERLKGKYGRTMAKYRRYLIKHSYVQQMENQISASMLRMQIELMK
ncbi:hypothetical protein [Paenibacillus agricola]|uniref:Uncharacterized protein n=1 Tax=Paenibacillus agricola TaxID=2716264 RepID=A0ABX0JHC7_9BACL|nr:hypothetical protein [Paenibacillus agricola]NHN33251.1 hypothetical protein [Paenibacillus agricola]